MKMDNYNLMKDKRIQVLAVTGGKGGVGKTNIAVNIGASLASMGKKTYLLDADFGLSNVDVILGLSPQLTLIDVIENRCQLEEIILKGPCGLQIIPGASGVQKLVQMQARDYAGMIHSFSRLMPQLDTFIIDTAPGIHSSVAQLAAASQEILVVVCDEPASIADAYAFIKLLHQQHGIERFRIIANMTSGLFEARQLFAKLTNVTDKYLSVVLHFLGWIPEDELIRKAIKRQSAVVEAYPSSAASQHFKELAKNILKLPPPVLNTGSGQFFMEQFFSSASALQ